MGVFESYMFYKNRFVTTYRNKMHKYIKTIDVSQNVELWYGKRNVPPNLKVWTCSNKKNISQIGKF